MSAKSGPARRAASTSTVTTHPVVASTLRFEHGAFGERFAEGNAGQELVCISPAHDNRVAPRVTYFLVIFGKIHAVGAYEFEQDAAKYHKLLGKEALLLYDSLNTSEQIFNEWANPSDSWTQHLVAQSVDAAVAIKGWFSSLPKRPKPDVVRFQSIAHLLAEATRQLDTRKLDYPTLRTAGLGFDLVRAQLHQLNHEIEIFRNGAIEAAEQLTAGAETVESTSFQVLGLVPTLMMMDPLREAAYRIGLVLLRLGGRTIGAWSAASTPEEAEREGLRQLCGVLKADVPPLMVDLLTGKLDRFLRGAKVGEIGREALICVVQQAVEFTCDFALLIYEKGDKFSNEDATQLLENRLVSILAKVAGLAFGNRPSDSGLRKWGRSLAENTSQVFVREFRAACDTARDHQPPLSTWEVFKQEAPWMVPKIIQGTLLGVMQRNAATARDIAAREGLDERHGWDFMKAQDASSIFSSKWKVPTTRALTPRSRIPPFTPDLQRAWENDLNLPADTLADLRHYSAVYEEIVAYRIPGTEVDGHHCDRISRKVIEHLAEPGVRPKPVDFKAKTAKKGPHEGLVVKPSHESHTDLAKAQAAWNPEALAKSGNRVREDGVVFHPDMLAKAPGDPRARDEAIRLLNSNPGRFDLSDPANHTWLAQQDPAAVAFLRNAKVGYASDVDLAEVIDGRSGQRNVLGDGAEIDHPENKTMRELEYETRNRERINDAVSDLAGDYRLLPQRRLIGERQPHHAVQHGPDFEYVKGPEGGPLAILFPDGTYTAIYSKAQQKRGPMTPEEKKAYEKAHNESIWTQYEAALQGYFGKRGEGAKYQERSLRGLMVRKTAAHEPTDWQEASGKGDLSVKEARDPGRNIKLQDVAGRGQLIDASRLDRQRRYFDAQRYDQPGQGAVLDRKTAAMQPVHPNWIRGSLLHRGLYLFVDPNAASPDSQRVFEVQQAQRVIVGVDEFGGKLVIACGAEKTVGDALGRLARAARALGIKPESSAQPFFEIYTTWKPVTSDHILDRIGGKETGVGKDAADLRPDLSSASSKAPMRLYAFRTHGFHPTYTPTAEEYQRFVVERMGIAAADARKWRPYPQIEGLWLMDVWEDSSTLALSWEPTSLFGHSVVVFPAPIAIIPSSVDMRRMSGVQRSPRASALVA